MMQRRSLAFAFVAVVAFALCASASISVDSLLYPNKVVLMDDFYTLHWRVDIPNDDIFFAFEVNTTGFIGFGIAEPTSGSMPGADVVTGSVRLNAQGVMEGQITDMYTTEFGTPSTDSCQDWVLINGREDTEAGITILEVSRKLHTLDSRDRNITAGLVRIIYSFAAGSSDNVGYHQANRGFTAVRFYESATSLPVQYDDTDVTLAEFHMNGAHIPAQATTYMCHSFVLPVTPGIPSHIIQIDPLVDPSTKAYVHHFFIHSCKNTTGGYVQQYLSGPAQCSTPVGRPNSGCTSELYAWAMGGGSLIVPAAAGYRMSDTNEGISHIVMELHYSNPNRVPNLVDNSGVRIHYTPNLRQHDAGVLQLGDPFLTLGDIPARETAFGYETTCPEECTREWDHDIIVFQDFLHMHELGDMIWSNQWTNNGTELVGPINRIEYYAFAQQQITEVNKVIKRGDRLNTHCVWNTRAKSTVTEMGIETTDEMCIDFLFYYPALRTRRNSAYSYCGFLGHPALGGVSMCGVGAADIVQVRNPSIPDPAGGVVKRFGLDNCIPPVTTTTTTSSSGELSTTGDATSSSSSSDSSSPSSSSSSSSTTAAADVATLSTSSNVPSNVVSASSHLGGNMILVVVVVALVCILGALVL